MRITEQQHQTIKQIVFNLVGDTQIILFGSRVDDTKKGGDVDLLITLQQPVKHPAQLSAKINVQLMRIFQGRKIDILLSAPNLKKFPIHTIAQQQGIIL